MDETVQRQADQIAHEADLRQWMEGVETVARVVARYHRALVACGTPEELAGELVIQYQAMLFVRGAIGAAGDGEE